MRRIGIDVGGTNTDAVLIEDGKVARAVKAPTSEDVTSGILQALARLGERHSGEIDHRLRGKKIEVRHRLVCARHHAIDLIRFRAKHRVISLELVAAWNPVPASFRLERQENS